MKKRDQVHVTEDFQEKIKLHYKVDQLYRSYNALQASDNYVQGQNINRERFQRRAKELMDYIANDLKGINYKVWPKYVELCEMLMTYSITPGIPELINLKKLLSNRNTSLCGLACNLNQEQIRSLYTKLKGNYIDAATRLNDFVSALTPSPVSTDDYSKVKWIKRSTRNQPNKLSFVDLMKLAGINKIDCKHVNSLFDIELTPANLNNNKSKPESEYIQELRTIFSQL